ncbi:unnamed protein product [Orchesella dallaii]|uniref:Gustatory receptor n=1 Tax=Orchesella dallaii TaxID=48710 RepID=A0ABP1QGG5_9HEXA
MRVTTAIEKFKSDETDEEISFLVPFFNFFYYLLLTPFKIVLDPETNQYSIKTHGLHKNNSEPSIITVFDFVSNFCFFITTSLTIFILWRRRDKFLEVIESTRVMTKRTNGIKILGIELYKALKKKADLITELFGNSLLSYYITTICYYAEAPYAFLGKRGDTEKATMVYFGCLSVIWILGAEFHRNIQETVLKWIAVHTENAKLSVEDRLKLGSLSNEMAADPIAFASKYFCVTYQQFSANNSEPSIITVFDFVSNFCFFITTSLTIFILWRRRDKFLEVIESTRVMTKRTNGIKILIYLFTAIASGVWVIINWFTFHHDGRFPSFDNCTIGQNATSLLACVSFLVLVFALGQLGKIFRNELDMKIGSKIVDIQKGIELYKALKKKADLITELFGNSLLSYYITTICYYAEAPYAFLGKRGDTEKATMVYFGCLSVIWILGAEFHRNIQETVLKWIAVHTENAKLSVEDRLKLGSLSNEMAADPIAFASKYFCVTYQQFSAMLGLVITYGIIVLQLQNGSTCMESS